MKYSIIPGIALLFTTATQAQLLKRPGNSVKYKIESRTENEINKAIDKRIDKVLGDPKPLQVSCLLM